MNLDGSKAALKGLGRIFEINRGHCIVPTYIYIHIMYIYMYICIYVRMHTSLYVHPEYGPTIHDTLAPGPQVCETMAQQRPEGCRFTYCWGPGRAAWYPEGLK